MCIKIRLKMQSDNASDYDIGYERVSPDTGANEIVRKGFTGFHYWEPVDDADLDFEEINILGMDDEIDNIIINGGNDESLDLDGVKTIEVCFNCGIGGCAGGCVEIDNVEITEEPIRESRLTSPFALGASTEVEEETLIDQISKFGNKLDVDLECDGNECTITEVTETDESGRRSSRRSSQNVASGERGSSNDIGGLEVIKPNPVLIEAYTVSDTNIPSHILSFVNAPGAGSYSKPHRQKGTWIVWGTNSCKYCDIAKRLLSEYNQTLYFLNRDTASEDQKRWIMSRNVDVEGNIPQVLLDNRLIGGSDKLKLFLEMNI